MRGTPFYDFNPHKVIERWAPRGDSATSPLGMSGMRSAHPQERLAFKIAALQRGVPLHNIFKLCVGTELHPTKADRTVYIL